MHFAYNIVLFISFQDVLWCNDFILDLETKKFFVAADTHEVYSEPSDEYFDEALRLCSNFIFILSPHSCKSNWLPLEYHYLKNRIDAGRQKIHFAKTNEVPAPSYIKDYYDFGKQYTQQYDNELSRLASELDF